MTLHERTKPFSGKNIAQIAREQARALWIPFLDIALDDELRTSLPVIDRNNDPEAQRQILGSPYTSSAPPMAARGGQGGPHGLQHPPC